MKRKSRKRKPREPIRGAKSDSLQHSSLANCKKRITFAVLEINGGVAEWSMAAVLKTVERQRSGGSNPSASAKNANSQAITAWLFLLDTDSSSRGTSTSEYPR